MQNGAKHFVRRLSPCLDVPSICGLRRNGHPHEHRGGDDRPEAVRENVAAGPGSFHLCYRFAYETCSKALREEKLSVRGKQTSELRHLGAHSPAGLLGDEQGNCHGRVDVRAADVPEAVRQHVDRQAEAPRPTLACGARRLPAVCTRWFLSPRVRRVPYSSTSCQTNLRQ